VDKRYKINEEAKEVFKRKKVCIMECKNLKSLNLEKLNSKKSIIVSSKNALKDVTPINWSNDILSGKKKVTISKTKDKHLGR